MDERFHRQICSPGSDLVVVLKEELDDVQAEYEREEINKQAGAPREGLRPSGRSARRSVYCLVSQRTIPSVRRLRVRAADWIVGVEGAANQIIDVVDTGRLIEGRDVMVVNRVVGIEATILVIEVGRRVRVRFS